MENVPLLDPGTEIDDYEILGLVAARPLCAIYEVKKGAARYALKIGHRFIDIPGAQWRRIAERLIREHNLLTSIDLPLVVKVHQFGHYRGMPYFVMDHIDGVTFTDYLAKRPRMREAMGTYVQLASTVAQLHEQGICHRDLTPDNIMVRTGEKSRVILLDFGCSQAHDLPIVTAPGEFVGTAPYISPQHAAYLLKPDQDTPYIAQPSDDVYALGVLLYQILTGTLPTRTPLTQFADILHETCYVVPPHPREFKLTPRPPEQLANVAMLLLRKDARQRLRDAQAVVNALVYVLNDQSRELWAPVPPRGTPHPRAPVAAAPSPVAPLALPSGQEVTPAPAELNAEPPAPPTLDPRAEVLGNRQGRPRRWLRRVTRNPMMLAHTALLVVVIVLLSVFTRTLTRAIEQLAALQQIGTPAAAANVPVSSSVLEGGLPMPETPDPSWLLCPNDCGKRVGFPCRDARGQPLRGVMGVRGVCWKVGANPNYLIDPPPKSKECPEGFYDPPADASGEDRELCFFPVLKKAPAQANSPTKK